MLELPMADTPGAIETAVTHSPPSRLSTGQIVRLSSLWFALQYFWASQQLVVMPEMVHAYAQPSNMGFLYGLIKSVGAVFVMATQLSVGFISDHAYSKLGRRRPFILFGITTGCAAICLFMLAPSYWWLFAGYILIEITINIASVPFQSLLPDLVPKAQHARAGSVMGWMHMAGYFFGLVTVILSGIFMQETIRGYRLVLLPLFLVLLIVFALWTVFSIDEHGWAQVARDKILGAVRAIKLLPGTTIKFAATAPTLLGCMIHDYSKVKLRSQPNFVYLWLSRFTVFLGYAAFIQYIKLHVKSNLAWQEWLISLGFSEETALGMADVAFAVIMLLFIIGGIVGTILSAPLAERYGKKAVIRWGMVLAAVVDIPLVMTGNVWLAIICGIGIGIGWGAFISADWAFACTLMPKQKAGSYMGIWDISTLLPQVISPALAGVLYQVVYAQLATGPEDTHAEAVAYKWVISSLLVYFAIGLWVLRYVKEER
jgi:MFS family permease